MGELGRLVVLGSGDLPDLQALFERCHAYFRLVHGAPPRPDEAERWLRDETASGKTVADKTVFGLRDDEERLVGAVDVVRDYPAPGEFYLGTMILEPTIRGVGLGATFHAWVRHWAREQGAKAVQLCVAVQNEGALRFWRREGYDELGTGRVRNGTLESEVVKMRMEL